MSEVKNLQEKIHDLEIQLIKIREYHKLEVGAKHSLEKKLSDMREQNEYLIQRDKDKNDLIQKLEIERDDFEVAASIHATEHRKLRQEVASWEFKCKRWEDNYNGTHDQLLEALDKIAALEKGTTAELSEARARERIDYLERDCNARSADASVEMQQVQELTTENARLKEELAEAKKLLELKFTLYNPCHAPKSVANPDAGKGPSNAD